MPSRLEQAQARRMKQIRGRSPGRAVSAAESRRRAADPERREGQKKTEIRANKAQAERYQKAASRAMKKDMGIGKMAREAAEAAGKRATKGLLGPLAGIATATELGANAVEAVVDPMAEMAKAERRGYNQRASTDQDTAARGVREAMSGNRMQRLQGEGMKKGGKVRGCGKAQRGMRKCKMVKMKGA